MDVRGCYCALAACEMLGLDKGAVAEACDMMGYIRRCQASTAAVAAGAAAATARVTAALLGPPPPHPTPPPRRVNCRMSADGPHP